MKERLGLPDQVLDMYCDDSGKARMQSDDTVQQDSKNLYVYGIIDSEDMRTFYKEAFGDDSVMSAMRFKNLLGDMENDFTIHINSPGGLVYEGVAINSLLQQTDKAYNVVVDGLCFSAATFFLSPNANVSINELAQIGIHRTWQCACGNINDMKSVMKELESYDERVMSFYQKRMKDTSEKELSKMMDDITYFTAQEAIDIGLADNLIVDKKAKAEKDSTEMKKARLSGLAAIAASVMARKSHDSEQLVN